MSITTIRICGEADARQMLRDGSFKDFLRMWSEQFPEPGSKLLQIKEIHGRTGCGLREAKRIMDVSGLVEEVRFGIGDDIYVRIDGDRLRLYRRDGSGWSPAGDYCQLDGLWESFFFPAGPAAFRFKDYGEF